MSALWNLSKVSDAAHASKLLAPLLRARLTPFLQYAATFAVFHGSDSQVLIVQSLCWAGGTDGVVVVWDTAATSAAASMRMLRHHKDAVVACGWSTDCSVLVSADKSGAVAFWQCS